ncbi:MAG TPA: hypothetical protein VG326_12230 [Tepidisphaeraceae bacterium]|jgi:hypothetical protein|nr:hypothetical protein [Tepidisphaeraceae bacterium]
MSTTAAPASDTPTAEMTDDQLATYAKGKIARSSQADEEMAVLGRRSIDSYYHAGWALAIARDRFKPDGKWVKWQNQNELPHSTVGNAIAFYERAEKKGIDELRKLGSLAEAKRNLGLFGDNGRENRSDRKRTPTPHKPHVLRFPLQTWKSAMRTIADVVLTVEKEPKTIAFGADLKEARKLLEALESQVAKIKEGIEEAAKIAPAMGAKAAAEKEAVAAATADKGAGGGAPTPRPKARRRAA